MARTVLFTGGKSGPEDISRHWLTGADRIIAADSGLDLCRRWGFTADLLCGDFDSIEDKAAMAAFPESAIVRHQAAKAWSDTELALHEAYRLDPTCETVLAGGNGGRSDHFYSLMKLYETDVYPRIWLGEDQAAICLDAGDGKDAVLTVTGLTEGETVSVFAVTVTGGEQGGNGNAWEGSGGRYDGGTVFDAGTAGKRYALSEYRIESDNLLWPLQDVDWSTGAESLSNWVRSGATELHLTARCGRFLVFVPLRVQAEYQVIQKVNGAGGNRGSWSTGK